MGFHCISLSSFNLQNTPSPTGAIPLCYKKRVCRNEVCKCGGSETISHDIQENMRCLGEAWFVMRRLVNTSLIRHPAHRATKDTLFVGYVGPSFFSEMNEKKWISVWYWAMQPNTTLYSYWKWKCFVVKAFIDSLRFLREPEHSCPLFRRLKQSI